MVNTETTLLSENIKGANLLGADLYQNLMQWLNNHLSLLLNDAAKYMDEELLQFYVKEWKRYTTGSSYVNHIFRYLNRHWVKREIDEGHRNIYDVYTVSCTLS
jgi:cullin 1